MPKALPPVGSCILIGFSNAMWLSILTLQLPLCGPFVLDHFLCEVPALAQIVMCWHHSKWSWTLLCKYAIPSSTLYTYCYIICFYCPSSVEDPICWRQTKAFGTCGSHLLVVSLFYGTAISMYLQPPSPSSMTGERWFPSLWELLHPCWIPDIHFQKQRG